MIELLTTIAARCDAIEEWYEFMLAYAAQGITDDRLSQHGSQLRELLAKAVAAATDLPGEYASMAAALEQAEPAVAQKSMKFIEVLKADTAKALAAMELVLAQPKISSQLADNLNASLHIRTLLTDVFILDEIVRLQR